MRAMRQKNQIELNLGTGARGEAPKAATQEAEARAVKASLERSAVAEPSMEVVVERENLKEALARVKRNKGAAGIDGMSVDDLPIYLKEHWPTIRDQLLPPSPPMPAFTFDLVRLQVNIIAGVDMYVGAFRLVGRLKLDTRLVIFPEL